ncbi:glycine betaine ABC transporter substrate-binding protein [Liquorilactobacillus oeni]|uniref:Glycine betaine L-proline ABC transporter, glycine betaine L-proline-binding protein n=1 Tax=Liquorilactobacillus oeni DSM 19972 TaxID=1423777 RepID=A0A0R1MAJ4_9LACO|nr:glycine betaine ABC transporter substrate-binding protein [Liquorilactobacillus oeni]KRL05062.1 glycine betaine L-proline ABC transporter, glycine betaine L-proline-binding protein [Liquorilactobacillus oeni DSM 19972]
MLRKNFKFLKWCLLSLLLIFLLSGCGSTTEPYHPEEKLGPQINYTITGIDAGAGIMGNTQTALEKYGLKNHNWQLQTSSTAAMTTVLGKAIKNKQPIVVTGWVPHWMFTKYKLKFLKDPKMIYGKSENIHSISRLGLQKDSPGVYTFLKNFSWNTSQISEVMFAVNNGTSPQEAAKSYLKKHPDQVKKWLSNVSAGKNKKITIAYVAWDSEIASANIAKEVLEKRGYQVDIRAMEAQPMWTAVATGAADFSLSAWLPTTHAVYAHKFKGKYIDVHQNLHGAKTGLAVPTYMKNINSIEDLKTK